MVCLLVGAAACTQPSRPIAEETLAAPARSGDAAPADSPATDVTVLDPGREPRVVLALKPTRGAEEEVEIAYRMHEGEGGPARGATRVLVNVRAGQARIGIRLGCRHVLVPAGEGCGARDRADPRRQFVAGSARARAS